MKSIFIATCLVFVIQYSLFSQNHNFQKFGLCPFELISNDYILNSFPGASFESQSVINFQPSPNYKPGISNPIWGYSGKVQSTWLKKSFSNDSSMNEYFEVIYKSLSSNWYIADIETATDIATQKRLAVKFKGSASRLTMWSNSVSKNIDINLDLTSIDSSLWINLNKCKLIITDSLGRAFTIKGYSGRLAPIAYRQELYVDKIYQDLVIDFNGSFDPIMFEFKPNINECKCKDTSIRINKSGISLD